MNENPHRLTYTQIIVFGYLAIIVLGALVLMLPVCSADGASTGALTALFTATSATCVTGLIVVDTYIHWSFFGQLVILFLIQVGGLGFMTIITAVAVAVRKRIGLHERTLLMQASGSLTRSGVVRLIVRIVIGTFIFEFIGAVLLAIRFIPRMGFPEGVWNSIFHSISAFCNAGFDLMGKYSPFSSLSEYAGDPLIILTLCFLIIIGGIGFVVWGDIAKNRFRFKKLELHSKLALTASGILLIVGWVLFALFEKEGAYAHMSFGEKVLASLFQSVTTRTAGFSSVDPGRLTDSSALLSSVFMIIGGSPGSTAGGIKTTTIAVLILGLFATSTNQSSTTAFKRSIDDSTVRRASAIVGIYLFALLSAVLVISALESFELKDVLFEAASAIGTAGLTTGITTGLCTASKLIIMLLMFAGRVGGLSLALLLGEKRKVRKTERPVENILIG